MAATYYGPGGQFNYIGNADYRGYLNYLGSTGNAQAKQLIGSGGGLGYVNNQGQINYSVPGSFNQGLVNANKQLYQQYYNYVNPSYLPGANALSGLGGNSAAVAPNWDINSIYNQAGAGAAAQVNPYYTKQLQEFQTNQTQAKALQDQQRQLQLQSIADQYNNTLQTNELQGQRTSADVLQNEQQIGQQADYRQQDQGQQFDQARIEQAKQIAGQGLTGSGVGNQQVLQSQTARNTQEARQGAQDQQQIAAQELTKARTFEDLARSNVLAGQSKAAGEKQSQIDWDKFVQGQAFDLAAKQDNLETERLNRLSVVQRQLAQQKVNDMILALSNPAQRAAATATYGGIF